MPPAKGHPWSPVRRAAYEKRYADRLIPMRTRCVTCYAEHDGTFGSGRFCCYACSRSPGGKNRVVSDETRTKLSVAGKRRVGCRHKSASLIKMKDARRLWWEQHECKRQRNEKGQFAVPTGEQHGK